MFTFIFRRVLYLPLVFLGVTLIIVLLMQLLSPAERASTFITSPAQLQHIDVVIKQYGLDKPWYNQYWRWIKNAVQGDLGYSRVAKMSVAQAIATRFPRTVTLALAALLPIVGVGIWMGTAAALNRDKIIDQISRVLAIIGWSLPTFVLGIWLLVVFYGGLDWFQPGQVTVADSIRLSNLTASGVFHHYTGFLFLDALLNGKFGIFLDVIWHLILPVITLSAVTSAQIMRVMRSSLLDALGQDYVRTARSKGLAERVVNNKHARRNALIPVLTVSGFTIILLFNGVVITETIFSYPGMGSWLADAATQLDYASVLGGAVFTAVVVVFANLVVDVLYALVDPRIRYD
ncbi:MAG: ABC transporter permease [Deinococcales bacterium]